MNDAHQRFRDWLTAGAEGDPARDLAVHASVCPECRRSITALDLLAIVNPGNAGMPPEPIGRERGRLALTGRLVGATAILLSAAILGVGVSQLIGVERNDSPVAQASQTPDQDLLGETATPQRTQPGDATPSAAEETLTPLGTPFPTQPHPAATPFPFPYWTFIPTPFPTAGPPSPGPSATGQPTPIPTGSATPAPTASTSAIPVPTATPNPVPTATPNPVPTATPVPAATPAPPLPQCSDGIDNDLDTFTDFVGLDPQCTDALDNDEAA